MSQMEGKVALVTGAGAGIGRASALALAQVGAAVCVSDIDGDAAEETAQLINDEGGNAISARCDVTQSDDVRSMVEATVAAFGPLDAAVNNAGIAGSFDDRLHEAEDVMFERVLAVNLHGVWHCLKAELAVMQAAKPRLDRQYRLGRRLDRRAKGGRLHRQQTRRRRPHQIGGARLRQAGHSRQCRLPRLHRHQYGAERDRGQSAHGAYHGAGDPDGTTRSS